MALSLLAAYGSSSSDEDESGNESKAALPAVAVRASPRPPAQAAAATPATTGAQRNSTTTTAAAPAAAAVVRRKDKRAKPAATRQLPMLQALPSFDDLDDDDDDDGTPWFAISTTANSTDKSNNNNASQSAAKKRKVGGGESKHRALLAKLPAPKHALDTAPQRSEVRHIRPAATNIARQPTAAQQNLLRNPSTRVGTSEHDAGADSDDSSDDDQEPASLKLIESLVGAVANDASHGTKAAAATTAHSAEVDQDEDADQADNEQDDVVGPTRPSDAAVQQAQYSYAYNAEDVPAPYVPEDERDLHSNGPQTHDYSNVGNNSAATSAAAVSGLGWNDRMAAKKLARRAEAQLYSLNNGATTHNNNNNNSGGGGSSSVATAEALAVLGAQGGGTVVSLSNNDFKEDAQRYRDSLPQDDQGPQGPSLQIKRWNTQTGEVTTSGRVGMTANRKNQISALVTQSIGREKELQEEWGKVKTGNADNRRKYGF
jgi:hypothetical protein